MGEGSAVHGAPEIEASSAGGTALFGILSGVGVGGHRLKCSRSPYTWFIWTDNPPSSSGGWRRRGAYQLDLVTPGMRPWEAISRKVIRDIWKRRMKARRRPETRQRLIRRVGLESRGSSDKPTWSPAAFNSARSLAYFSTVLRLRLSRSNQLFLAIGVGKLPGRWKSATGIFPLACWAFLAIEMEHDFWNDPRLCFSPDGNCRFWLPQERLSGCVCGDWRRLEGAQRSAFVGLGLHSSGD